MDGPELSGDDRSITSDIQDTTEANLDHDSMDSDREALNLVSIPSLFLFILVYYESEINRCPKGTGNIEDRNFR